jgi:hypothetical protein
MPSRFFCRTFDYDVQANCCRLFEIKPLSGQNIDDLSLTSQFGCIQLFLDRNLAFTETYGYCIRECYLISIYDSCQYP